MRIFKKLMHMKKIASILSLTFLLGLFSFTLSPDGVPDTYKFDPSKSSIQWTSTAEDGTTHTGSLNFKSGTLKFDVKTLLNGFSYINMQTLTCSDVVDEGFNRELIVEMRSDEQLNLAKYKEATFKIVKAKRLDVPEGKPNYDIDGIVKLKGIDVPVKFTATVLLGKKEVNFKGSFVLPKDKAQLPYDLTLDIAIVADLVK